MIRKVIYQDNKVITETELNIDDLIEEIRNQDRVIKKLTSEVKELRKS